MGKINVLSPQTANLIAAGEVVERPGSVVKELVENAIDAGSSVITVEIKNGGIAYIRVSDDGSGIAPDDVETAFLRHATSKIRDPLDMINISTMGFRGEALAAISAVARVDIFTRTSENDSGIHMTCEGGESSPPAETGCPRGTTITVRDLFYNVPARMKFLKKDSTEASYCESAVVGAALSHPEISFRFIKDGRESFFTSGKGSLLQTIASVFGSDVAAGLLPIKGVFPHCEISGCVSPVTLTRAGRNMQFFLVNGRPVKGKILSAAVDGAYKGKMMPGRYPIVFINIRVPYSAVDVNVHPAKLEVKFSREKEVYSAISNTISMAIEGAEMFPEVKLPEPGPVVPPVKEDNLTGYQQRIVVKKEGGRLMVDEPETGKSYELASRRPMYAVSKAGDKPDPRAIVHRIDALGAGADKNAGVDSKVPVGSYAMPPEDPLKPLGPISSGDPVTPPTAAPEPPVRPEPAVPESRTAPEKEQEPIRVIGQAFDTYIIAQQGDGLWLIDKHAAHERIIYNKLTADIGNQDMQTLMQPIPVALTPDEKQVCLDNLELLERSGFELEDYGLSGLSVRRAPTYIEEEDVPFVLSDMANKLNGGLKPGSEALDELLKSISCKAAVKGGSYSSIEEMQQLAEQVLTRDDVTNCPHGRPSAIFMTRYQLEKQFKRIL